MLRILVNLFHCQEVAGANQTYPSILGMVGLRLHVGDEQQARVLRVVALKGTTVEYSLVGYQSNPSFFC